MLTRIYHKKNELFQVEFYQDKECTNLIKHLPYSENSKKSDINNFYIELKEGDIAPITSLLSLSGYVNDYFYTPYVPSCQSNQVKTLDDIAVNLSKYTPEDNAVLFLNEGDKEKYQNYFPNQHIGLYIDDGKNDEEFIANNIESLTNGVAEVKKENITIFLTHGTESELKKAHEIARELKKKHRLEKVNLFILHCFGYLCGDDYIIVGFKKENDFPTRLILDKFIDKVIATNSIGISEPQDEERLQILDCYDIFNNHLKGE